MEPASPRSARPCLPAMKLIELSVVPLQSSQRAHWHPGCPALAGRLGLAGSLGHFPCFAWPGPGPLLSPAILRQHRSLRKTGYQYNIQLTQLPQYLGEILVIVNSRGQDRLSMRCRCLQKVMITTAASMYCKSGGYLLVVCGGGGKICVGNDKSLSNKRYILGERKIRKIEVAHREHDTCT